MEQILENIAQLSKTLKQTINELQRIREILTEQSKKQKKQREQMKEN